MERRTFLIMAIGVNLKSVSNSQSPNNKKAPSAEFSTKYSAEYPPNHTSECSDTKIFKALAYNGYYQNGKLFGDDDAPLIEEILQGQQKVLFIRASCPRRHSAVDTAINKHHDSNESYVLIDSPISIPAGKSLIGYSDKILIGKSKLNADATTTVFFLNVNDKDGLSLQKLTNTPATEIRGLEFNAYHVSLDGYNVRTFLYCGSPIFEDLKFLGVSEIAASTNDYNDSPTFRRISAFECPTHTADNWLLNHSSGWGDGGKIEQCHFLGQSNSKLGGSYDRAQAIRLHNRNNWTIDGIINGDIYISKCRGTKISSLYMERGQTIIESSRGTRLTDSVYFMRDTGQQAIVPLICRDSSPKPIKSRITNFCVLENILFCYDPLGRQVPWVESKALGNYDKSSRENFRCTGNGNYILKGVYREFSPADYEYASLFGSTCGNADFDDYSHISSTESTYHDGAWSFSASLGGMSNPGFTAEMKDKHLNFSEPTGVYRYLAQFLYDKRRRTGEQVHNPVEIFADQQRTPGRGGAITFRVEPPNPCLLRIFRATPECPKGMYDTVVEFPVIARCSLFDLGEFMNERKWVARPQGPPDPIVHIDLGFELKPQGVASDAKFAYGSAKCRTTSHTTPNCGVWRTGDKIYVVRDPRSNGVTPEENMVWTRVTTGDTHKIDIDWERSTGYQLD